MRQLDHEHLSKFERCLGAGSEVWRLSNFEADATTDKISHRVRGVAPGCLPCRIGYVADGRPRPDGADGRLETSLNTSVDLL